MYIGSIKKRKFQQHIKIIFLKLDMVFIHEHKMSKSICDKMGALGIRQGHGYQNKVVLNSIT